MIGGPQNDLPSFPVPMAIKAWVSAYGRIPMYGASLYRAAAVRTKGSRDQAETAREQDQHDHRVKEAGGLKVNVEIGDNTREDEKRPAGGQQPADDAASAEEQHTDAEQHRQQRDAERVRAVKIPVRTAHHHLVGQKVPSEAGHCQAE